ncbi:MAG: glycosyltransferase [Planctomycetia bacterium]|nr:glycosyltransferase [Planctomycetia bacterium]
MPKLSIIIPYHADAPLLEETLLSLLESRPDDCEILVVLNAPYDNPYELQEAEVRFVENLYENKDDATSLRVGLERCTSPLVQMIPCGCVVSDGWTNAAMEAFSDDSVGCVRPHVVNRETNEPVAEPPEACGIFLRREACAELERLEPGYLLRKLEEKRWKVRRLSQTSVQVPACHLRTLPRPVGFLGGVYQFFASLFKLPTVKTV